MTRQPKLSGKKQCVYNWAGSLRARKKKKEQTQQNGWNMKTSKLYPKDTQ